MYTVTIPTPPQKTLKTQNVTLQKVKRLCIYKCLCFVCGAGQQANEAKKSNNSKMES